MFTTNAIRLLLLSVMGQSVMSADAARSPVLVKNVFVNENEWDVHRELSSTLFNQIKKLNAPDGAEGDRFGYSVDVSGNLVVVGAPYDDDKADRSGSVYVFDAASGDMTHKLDATDGTAIDEFALSVAISGNLIVVGKRFDDDKGNDSGAAYVFNATSGNMLHKLTAPDGAPTDFFGRSVDVSGNIIVVGANRDDDKGADSGSVYLFDAASGDMTHKLVAMDGVTNDWFGVDVAISGNVVVVGSRSEAEYAYAFDAASGNMLYKLTAPNGAGGDQFGTAVAISGNAIVVGARNDDEGRGAAYLFDATSGNFIYKLTAPDGAGGDNFGNSVDISGNLVSVGSRGDDDKGSNSGSVYLFDAASGTMLQKLTATDGAEEGKFGWSVAVSGNRVVVGAFGDDDKGVLSGAAYIFESPSTLAPTAALTLAPTAALTLAPTAALTLAPTAAPTLAPTEAPQSGAGGDPIIMGLNSQVFKFEGRNEGWYANVFNKYLFWNMQFRKFDTCPLDENMFITGMSIFTFGDSDSEFLIATTPEPSEECRINPHAICLGEGTLHISFDGGRTFMSQPGDYHYGSRGRVVAHNTYAACSRKWHDYDVTEGRNNNLRDGGRRTTVVEKKPLQLLSDKKATMIDAKECGSWIDDRINNNDLFQQKGHWSTLHIETDVASFQVEYRRSDWFNPKCDFQSLDAWMTKVDSKMEKMEWNGVLGETKEKIYYPSGEQVLSDRSKLLRGKDDADYEVDGPFGTSFVALKEDSNKNDGMMKAMS